ncbi:MAG: hypothetical protein IPP77_02585 [Bacteroidetes bacterium]|nr:hypothetical protein [Bacteroidota bacterium]
MKKKFMNLSAVAMLSASFILGSCDNAAENQKLMDADNTAIQTMVDAKMAELQAQADADCTAQVQEKADALYAEAMAAASKGGKKVVAKPVAKPAAKKEEPKPETVGSGKPKMGTTSDPNTVGSGKPKMGATGSTGSNTIGNGKPKMGSTDPK